jgi:hypothetical protein
MGSIWGRFGVERFENQPEIEPTSTPNRTNRKNRSTPHRPHINPRSTQLDPSYYFEASTAEHTAQAKATTLEASQNCARLPHTRQASLPLGHTTLTWNRPAASKSLSGARHWGHPSEPAPKMAQEKFLESLLGDRPRPLRPMPGQVLASAAKAAQDPVSVILNVFLYVVSCNRRGSWGSTTICGDRGPRRLKEPTRFASQNQQENLKTLRGNCQLMIYHGLAWQRKPT